MKEILESVAVKAANGWQRAGSKFDFEVFAMPGRQCDGACALGLLNDDRRAETPAPAFYKSARGAERARRLRNGLELCLAAVPLNMTIVDSVMFLVILAGFGLGLAYFGVGFSAIRGSKRQR